MSAISFMFLILKNKDRTTPGLTWREKIQTRTQIHPAWFESLENSIIGDFDHPRVGGIMDTVSFRDFQLLSIFERIKIPIYLRWGQIFE